MINNIRKIRFKKKSAKMWRKWMYFVLDFFISLSYDFSSVHAISVHVTFLNRSFNLISSSDSGSDALLK